MSLTGPAPYEDTIVAPATAPGVAAISVIRLSGSRALEIANNLFPAKDLSLQPSHTLHHGVLEADGQSVDEVVVGWFKGPSSYTGEDVIEISCHGAPLITEQVIGACLRQGARLAGPGEFTRRAFLNGKMDLAQAEAVADLIASHSEAARRSALSHLRGGFSRKLGSLREQLIQFSALIELELDFSQEDVSFADREQLYRLVDSAIDEVTALIGSFTLGNAIKAGVNVAIIGKPNAGKSTLLNALVNDDRAIVSEVAGTTRDTIEETLNIEGVLFRIVDTAGIREHTSDEIEGIGVQRSLQKMEQADLVIYLFDVRNTRDEVDTDLRKMEAKGIQFIPVANKADLLSEGTDPSRWNEIPGVVTISAQNPSQVEELCRRLFNQVTGGSLSAEDTVLTNARHLEALQRVLQSLEDIRNGMNDRLPGDLLALDIRHCLHYIGEITGMVTNKDVLDYVFSKFCIGK
jgi:tRNA modification GTPase